MASTAGVASRWVQAQKSTPSFEQQGAANAQANPLDRPLPAALARYDVSGTLASPGGPTSPSSPSSRRRYPSPGPGGMTPTSMGRSVTPPAARRSGKPIHEDLIERGRLYYERKEALREKAIRRELSNCRAVPRVNRNFGSNGEEMQREPIVSRLYKLQKEKARLDEFKMMGVNKQDEALFNKIHTFSPQITKTGHNSKGTASKRGADNWAARREQRLLDLRLQQIAVEMSGLQDTPEINQRSHTLAQRRREAEGLAGISPFEAMLERDRLAKLAQWEKQQLRVQLDNPGTPRITEMAARMHSDVGVVERLTAQGEMREAKLRQARDASQRDAAAATPTRSAFGAPSSSGAPHDYPSASRGSPSDLYEKNMAFMRRRDERLDQIRAEELRRHHPEIDPNSASMTERFPETAQDRLLHLRSRTPPRQATTLRASQSPTPNRTGHGGATPAGADPAAAVQRLLAAEKQRQRRLDETRDELLRREAEQSPFAPTLSRGTVDRFGGSNTPPPTATSPPPNSNGAMAHATPSRSPAVQRIFERSMAWAQQREERLAEARAQREAAEMQDATFEPDTSLAQQRTPHDPGLYGGDGRAWGFDDYVGRMQNARGGNRGGADEGSASPSDAHGLRQHTTVPQEFHIGAARSDKPQISALQPPVRPPTRNAAEGDGASMPETRDAARRLADMLMVQQQQHGDRRHHTAAASSPAFQQRRHSSHEEDGTQYPSGMSGDDRTLSSLAGPMLASRYGNMNRSHVESTADLYGD